MSDGSEDRDAFEAREVCDPNEGLAEVWIAPATCDDESLVVFCIVGACNSETRFLN